MGLRIELVNESLRYVLATAAAREGFGHGSIRKILSSLCDSPLNHVSHSLTKERIVIYQPPVTLWELAMPEVVTLTARRGMPKAGLVTGVKS